MLHTCTTNSISTGPWPYKTLHRNTQQEKPLIQQVYYLKLDEKSTGGRAWGRKGDRVALVLQGDAGAQIEV